MDCRTCIDRTLIDCPSCDGETVVYHDCTIRADIVAAGVGLPAFWMSDAGNNFAARIFSPRELVDASDPQIAFGLALELDEWELKSDPDWWDADTWMAKAAMECAPATLSGDYWHGHRVEMLARIEHIGLDHAIRRALGWEVEPGTLAAVECQGDENGDDIWLIQNRPGECAWFYCPEDTVDPIEALRAIHAEVANA